MIRLTHIQIQKVCELAEHAASCAMSFYRNDIEVDIKKDNSPVTMADLAISRFLEKELPKIADFPVLSEENQPKQSLWRNWRTYWLVDPIDGTKHFINKTGEFCICIALIHENQSVFGLINAPSNRNMWVGQLGEAQGDRMPLLQKYYEGQLVDVIFKKPSVITVALGQGTLSERMKTLLSCLPEYRFYMRGSALKFIDLVEGRANIYPKMWDICEWDCASGHCILNCAGGAMIRFERHKSIQYGAKDSLLSPHFLAYNHLDIRVIESLQSKYAKIFNR